MKIIVTTLLITAFWLNAFQCWAQNKKKSVFSFEKTAAGIVLKKNNQPVFQYITKSQYQGPDSTKYYSRTGFIHPLYAPDGSILTDDYPVGHVHQHALFTAWTKTTFKGNNVDFWNQQKKIGTVAALDGFEPQTELKNNQAVLRTKQIHYSLVNPVDGKPAYYGKNNETLPAAIKEGVLAEDWEITAYELKGMEEEFVLQIKISQKNISSDTLFFEKHIYGGFAIRGASRWNIDDKNNFRQHWVLESGNGKKDSAINHTGVEWLRFYEQKTPSAASAQRTPGGIVFDHPQNFRYPQKVRVHPVMPYFAFSPCVDGPFFLPPHQFYTATYWLVLSSKAASLPAQKIKDLLERQ
jgi:hypothetical protein